MFAICTNNQHNLKKNVVPAIAGRQCLDKNTDCLTPHAAPQVCKQITKNNAIKKPVLVLKSGRSPEGAKAAMSHTGALMGSDEIYDALQKQSGAIRVDTMEELFDYATAFSKQPLPVEGYLVIVSNSGGPSII